MLCWLSASPTGSGRVSVAVVHSLTNYKCNNTIISFATVFDPLLINQADQQQECDEIRSIAQNIHCV